MGILVRNNKVISAGGKILYSRSGNPFELPNLKLYLSATKMTQQADNTTVQNFIDFSGLNYHATQNNNTLRPTFQTNEFGINAGIKFDSVDDQMSITGGALDIFRNINQYTVQIATKRNVVSDNCFDFYVTNNANTAVRFAVGWLGSNLQVIVRRADVDAITIILVPINDTSPHLVQVTLNNSNYTVYVFVDGQLAGISQLVGSGNLDNTACAQINVGWYNVSSSYSKSCINGISVNTSYSDNATIQAQYRGYLQRGYL